MPYRGFVLAYAAGLAFAFASCRNPPPKQQTPPVNLCEPLPLTEAMIVHQISAGGGSLFVGEHAFLLSLPLEGCPDLGAIAQLVGPCLQGDCGPALDVDRMNDLQTRLAGVTPVPVVIGSQLATSFVTEDGAYIGWPRDPQVPPEPVITGAGTPQPSPPAEGLGCCPGCAPCLPGQCTSNPPPRPRRLIAASEQCDCPAVQEQHCPRGGEPDTEVGACQCADECCPPPPSS
jgi:hypothetical protein